MGFFKFSSFICLLIILSLGLSSKNSFATQAPLTEPVHACVLSKDVDLTDAIRFRFAECLGWQRERRFPISPLCEGYYEPIVINPLDTPEEIRIVANETSLYQTGTSKLSGGVEVQQNQRVVNAQTAYIYRDPKTEEITQIELIGNVHYKEPNRLMLASRAKINPQDKSGKIENVLYRFQLDYQGAILPAWGRAESVERTPCEDYFLKQATYSTCAPSDRAWQIEADSIDLDHANEMGIARNAKLRIYDWTVLSAPYFTFPTSKKRKSGFLMPIIGSSNIGGFEYTQPYYWNIAPNYDATFLPRLYSRRGVMLGGQFRYLLPSSSGVFNVQFLPRDQAFRSFINENKFYHPSLAHLSTNRWSVQVLDNVVFSPNLKADVNFQQVSDDYFLEDFSSNLAVLTERQLLREGNVSYTTDHWLFHGMLQSYQTLHPINQTPILNPYQRLPQLMAFGNYNNLFLNAKFSLLAQYDEFTVNQNKYFVPEGPRIHLNPILSFPFSRPWGFFKPTVELVENYYGVNTYNYFSTNSSNPLRDFIYPLFQKRDRIKSAHYNRTIPRYSLDMGLNFDRLIHFDEASLIQTLEPHLYYLYVPYANQTPIPVYDSGYMIFSANQLFRNNRFSGFDRIGDANQLTYALGSRLLSEKTGQEKASFLIGQIRYFSKRRVQLCQKSVGECFDSPYTLGYTPRFTSYSPVAMRGNYNLSPIWSLSGDYVWNAPIKHTNNANLYLRYEPGVNQIINLGYSYLYNGDLTTTEERRYNQNHMQVNQRVLNPDPLNQINFAIAWPLNDHWSGLGGYNYNISKQYEMTSFLGIQYDTCCWAARLSGGRTFQSLKPDDRPNYNNNIYFQILLKGLGSVGNSDPESTIHTYIPTYIDSFHRE